MSLVPPGKYIAQLAGPIDGGTPDTQSRSGIFIQKAKKTGSLMATICCHIAKGPEEVTRHVLKYHIVIVKVDPQTDKKTPNDKGIKTLQDIFGWATENPYWMVETDLSAVRFEIVVVDQQSEKDGVKQFFPDGSPKMFSKIAWVNPIGGSSLGTAPKLADKNTIMAEYGSILRATAPAKPMARSAVQPSSPPAKPAAPKPPVTPSAPAPAVAPVEEKEVVSNADEVWTAFTEANPGKSEEELTSEWWKMLYAKFRLTQDKTNLIAPQQWGQLLCELKDNVPY